METKWYPIKGKVVLTKDQKYIAHIDTITQTVFGHLERAGMTKVRQSVSDSITFKGGKTGGNWSFLNLFELKFIVGKGLVKITHERLLVAARYYLRPSKLIILSLISPLIFLLIPIYLESDHQQQTILILAGIFILYIFIIYFGLVTGIKDLLNRAFQTAEVMVEAKPGNYDTSAVDTEHLDLSASNLIKTAYYFQNQGQRDKARHYFALLIYEHPWTEEAVAALKELKST